HVSDAHVVVSLGAVCGRARRGLGVPRRTAAPTGRGCSHREAPWSDPPVVRQLADRAHAGGARCGQKPVARLRARENTNPIVLLHGARSPLHLGPPFLEPEAETVTAEFIWQVAVRPMTLTFPRG